MPDQDASPSELVEITEAQNDVVLDIAYATENNFTGRVIYQRAICYLHPRAARALQKAIDLAKTLGYRFKIFDGFRPSEAQWKLWEICSIPGYVADPRVGSFHSRGIAVDLTLIDQDGQELDMGTEFDAFKEESHHANQNISQEAQKNRFMLLGIMTAAGWNSNPYEWWHYQLPNASAYPLLCDRDLGTGMMSPLPSSNAS